MKTISTTLYSICFLAFSLTMGTTTMLAQPVNDLIENAIDLDELPIPYLEEEINFSTATLLNDVTDQPGCDLFLAGIWYKFTATTTATVTASIITNGTGWVVFFSAPDENVTNGLELIYTPSPNNGCGGGLVKSIETEPGTTYYIYMHAPSLNADASINLGDAINPANDLIENAIDLAQGPILFNPHDVNFPEATSAGDGGQSGCNTQTDRGLWYKFTATSVGEIGAGFTNGVSPIVIFYSAPNANATSGSELTHVDQPQNICNYSNFALITTTIGTTYYIFMANEIISDIIINTEEVFAAPANDHITNATNLNGLEDFNDPDVHFLMATNTDDGGQSGCDTGNAPGVWYKFTAPIDGQVVAGIGIGPNDGAIRFYSAENENATSGADLTYVSQQSNPCGPGNLSSIMAEAGITYYIITGTDDAKATVSINLAGILGTNENTFEDFKYYPNPVINELNLSAKSTIDEVSIFNLMGQKVFFEKTNASKKSIDLTNLQSGMYVIKVTAEGSTASYKIIKQ